MALLDDGQHVPFSYWAAEMQRLVEAAGGAVVATVVQRRQRPDGLLLFGPGKVAELGSMVRRSLAQAVVVSARLSPVQKRNLEDRIGCPVLDRTECILEIFADRAESREGKLQVELAELIYRLPRLKGQGPEMSRLGGGIGTRGPGETELEVERRRVMARMARIRRELKEIARRRQELRQGRREVLRGALVGYTNAGKSSLLEALGEHYVGAEDRLFATLDPRARRVRLLGNVPMVLTDTVGFLRDLPPELIHAFHATLEEVREADFLIHVVDASSPDRDEQVEAVEQVLGELGVAHYPTVLVYNKADLLPPGEERFLPRGAVLVSAKRREGLERLAGPLRSVLADRLRELSVRLPFEAVEVATWLRRRGQVLGEQVDPEGMTLLVRLLAEDADRLAAQEGVWAVAQVSPGPATDLRWEATR